MSVRWRRNRKRPRKLNSFKAWIRIENRKIPRTFGEKETTNKKRMRPQVHIATRTLRGKRCKEPEPLIDVLDERDEVIIVAEVAGFKREHLKIHLKNQCLILSAETTDRKYYKSLNLPIGVIPTNMRTVYKNGVLEIRLKKVIHEKAVDKMTG